MAVEGKNVQHLIDLKKTKCNHLVNILSFDTVSEEQKAEANSAGLKIYGFQEVVDEGKKHPEVILQEPTPETVYMFCYTSGTTGDPKGSLLTHKAFVMYVQITDYFEMNFTENDISISYLPYAHVFE